MFTPAFAFLNGLFALGLLIIFYLMSYLKALHFDDPAEDIVLTLACLALSYYALSLGGIIFSTLTLLATIAAAHDLYWAIRRKPLKKLNLLKIKR